MPPTESPRSRPLPDELLKALREAAKVNQNYEPTKLVASVRQDISRALINEDGEELSEAVRMRNVEVLCEAIRARVAQIKPEGEENLLWKGVHAGSSPQAFRGSPRRLLKSAQEALVHPADRVAGRFSVHEERDEQDLVLPIHIAIDPLRLSDRLIINLGFGHMLAPKGSSRLDQMRAKIQIIPRIKQEVLANLDPIPLSPASYLQKNYRLFRISKGTKRGFVLGAQEIAGDDRLYITTIPGAKRRVDHIEDQYVKEQAQLARIHNKLDEIDLLLKEDWPSVKAPRRLRALLATLHGLVEELKFVIDDDKKELHDAIEKAAAMLARKNKGAAFACINTMRRNRFIDRRQREIPRIFGELAKDKLMIQGHANREEVALERLYEAVHEQKSEPRIADPNHPLKDSDRPALIEKLNRMAEACERNIQFQPSLAFAEKIVGYLRQTSDQLFAAEPERQALAEDFMKAYVVSKLSRFHHFLLSLYEAFSVHGMYGVSVPEWKKELEEAERELNEHGIAKKIYTPEYNGIWVNLRGLIVALKKAMNQYGKTRSAEQREEPIDEIKKLISGFDLPGQVRAIPFPSAL